MRKIVMSVLLLAGIAFGQNPSVKLSGGVKIGVNSSVNGQDISPKSINGVRYAKNNSGSDWVAKVASAIADLPTGGGTIFVSSDMAGVATGSLSIPANVNLQFDAGTFTLSGSLNVNGLNHSISGVRGATSLVFSGATDGIVMDTTTSDPRYTAISDLKVITTNASAGAAFKSTYTGASSPTDIELQRVVIDTSGSGKWAYGLYLVNVQYSRFYNVRIIGYVDKGIHLQASEENLFDNFFFHPHGGTPSRCIESLSHVINGSYSTFIGGGCYGLYSSSVVYVEAGALYIYAFTTDIPDSSTPSDGADVVLNGGIVYTSGGKSPAKWLVKGGSQLYASSSNFGDITLDVAAAGASIVNSFYRSLTNNMTNNVTLLGNRDWGGGREPILLPGGCGVDSSGNMSCPYGTTQTFSTVNVIAGYQAGGVAGYSGSKAGFTIAAGLVTAAANAPQGGTVTTGSIAGSSSAAVTLTWGTAFSDALYSPACSVVEATTSGATLRVHHIESILAASVTVRVVNDDTNPHTGTLSCTAIR